MAKMKWRADDVDWKGLQDEEFEDNDFPVYDGPEPPANILLSGQIDKCWLVESAKGDWMFKVVFQAKDNEGDRKVYEEWSCWDNVLWSLPQCKFMWQPFLDALGISLKDIKDRTIVGEEDNVGTVVERIGKVEFPAFIRIKTSKVKTGDYKGKIEIAKYLPPLDMDDVEEEDEDGEPPF